MLSSRRIAQLGLSAASLTLVTSVTILIAGSAQPEKAPASVTPTVPSAHVAPIAVTSFNGVQTDQSQRLTLAK